MAFRNAQLGCATGHPYQMRRFSLPVGGDPAIFATVRMMEALVRGPEGVRSPDVRVAAIEAAKGSGRGQSEIQSVFSWVKKNIEFRGEYAETLQTPKVTLQLKAGDCDDHAILTSALLASLGYKVRFKTVAAVASDPKQFSHVYAEVLDKFTRQWIPLDTTVARSYVGWAPEKITRSKSYGTLGLVDWGSVASSVVSAASTGVALANQQAMQPPQTSGFNVNLGVDNETGIPDWVIYAGVAFMVYEMLKSKRGSR
jgi:hypothetical protein